MSYHVVLYQPEIPANTGNIARLCVGCNSELHIIKPMRFFLTDKYLKRAGLDYWEHLKLKFYESLEEFLTENDSKRIFLCSTKGAVNYSTHTYEAGDCFIFGSETRGLPQEFLATHRERSITIPMSDNIRSHNLANSVAIILYEAWRQINFC